MDGAQRADDDLPSRSIASLLGTVCLCIGLIDVIGAIWPGFRNSRLHQLAEVLPGAVSTVATAAALVVGILLVLLAHGLKRRKRRAWRAAVVLLAVSVALDVLRWHAMVAAVVSAAFLVALIAVPPRVLRPVRPAYALACTVELPRPGHGDLVLGLLIVSAHPRHRGRPVLRRPDDARRLRLRRSHRPGLLHREPHRRPGPAVAGRARAHRRRSLRRTCSCDRNARRRRSHRADEERLRALLAKHGTRDSSATSRCAVTRASSSRPAARPPWPTG